MATKKTTKTKSGVVVLVPSRGLLITSMMQSLLDELRECPHIKKYEIIFSEGKTVDKARQWLAEEGMKRKWAGYFLWVDDDQVLLPGVLTRMFEAEADFAATHAVNRSPKNLAPNMTLKDRQKTIFWFPPDNIRKDFDTGLITFVSLAVCLVKRRVFEEIPKPWFKSELDSHLPARYWEDSYFGDKLLKNQQDLFKIAILPEFSPHLELSDYAGIKGDNTNFHSYFHSDVQCHKFRVYDKDTLFPMLNEEGGSQSLIHGENTPDSIEVAERFKEELKGKSGFPPIPKLDWSKNSH
jgi:hypothetical protein